MPDNHPAGEAGEKDVIRKVNCPNCGKKLIRLPKNYPLCDVQCVGCHFRAQVKTNNTSPKKEIFGAGWEIMDKVLKSGYMVPPLIVNFKWKEKGRQRQEILFYPFIPKTHLKKRVLSRKAKRGQYKMFNYVRLDEIPRFTLYER